MKWLAFAALGIVFGVTFFSPADSAATQTLEFSGVQLNALCASADATQLARCQSFIFGVAQGIALGRSTSTIPNVFCIPDGVEVEPMAAIVQSKMKLLDAKELELPAIAAVGAALTNAYPCPGSVRNTERQNGGTAQKSKKSSNRSPGDALKRPAHLPR